MAVIEGAIERNAIRQKIVTGAVAGDVTVTGLKKSDKLVSVFNLTDITELTSEFTVPAAGGKINNTGGTSTASKKLLVTYLSSN